VVDFGLTERSPEQREEGPKLLKVTQIFLKKLSLAYRQSIPEANPTTVTSSNVYNYYIPK
jgi:hypothetical protein